MRVVNLGTISKALLGCGIVMLPVSGYSQDAKQAELVGAKPVEAPAPTYPINQRIAQNSGMVDLRFMVDENGSVYETIIIESSNEAFEEEALIAIRNYDYVAATYAGEPVRSATTAQIFFNSKGAEEKVHPDFAKLHGDATRELARKSPNAKNVARKIRKLERFNKISPYTYTYINLLKFRYAKTFGDVDGQISSAKLVLQFEELSGSKGPYVKPEIRISIKRELFGLYVNSRRYGEALNVYQELIALDSGAEARFGAIVTQLYAAKRAKNPVSVMMTIEPRGHGSLTLFKQAFSISEVNGKLLALNLRCDRNFASLAFDLTSEYKIPEKWGQCYLQVIGEPATTFKLTEF
ncbi:MAG: TonB family protein [Cryomorphaceae bacterium]|jgi:TonB family protein